jgi:eukaryotic-like serine/threonine-protein kinase
MSATSGSSTFGPGAELGPYRIESLLGTGGMGHVFRARDTRLDRLVAIKTSRERFDERFQREARTVAQLNHPHICTLHDVGREGDTNYLVMELVAGETLADRLRKGPMPTAEVLRLGAQMADALDRAHRAGIVHRDLKPGNVMLSKSGIKLLDFGLARAVAPGGAATVQAESPTMNSPITAHGTIVGTVPYMAPEQLEGKESDARSDLWALGCVLYEMMTGTQAFEGTSQASLIAAILKEQPRALAALAPLTPPALEHLVHQCLAKDPDDRWQTAGDLRRELVWIAEAGSASVDAPMPAPKRASRERIAWGLAVVAVVTAVALALSLGSGRTTNSQPVFTALTYRPAAIFRAAFAPDGKTVVFSAAPEGNTPQLFVLRPENPLPQPFGEPGTHLLSVSSKGELAVLTGATYLSQRLFTGTLARMPLGGGAPREVLEHVREADWAPSGSDLAIIREAAGKDRLEYPIGKVLYECSGYLSDLSFSPQGDRIAFFEHPSRYDDRGSVNTVDLQGKRTMLSDGYWGEEGIAWEPDGRAVLFSASQTGTTWTVYAVTPDGKRRVALRSAGGQTIHDVNAQGRWLTTRDDQTWHAMVRLPGWQEERDMSWLDASLFPHLSEDDRIVAFTEQGFLAGNNYAVCLRKTDGGDVLRLGDGLSMDLTPDGKYVLATIFSPPQIVAYPTGPGEPKRLDRGGLENFSNHGRWFPGGDSILFEGHETGKATRMFVQRLDGAPRSVTPEGTSAGLPSRDGTFVLAKGGDGAYKRYPLSGGGEPRPVPWLTRADVPIRTSRDGRSVLSSRPVDVPTRVEQIDLESGRRTLVREIAPRDRVGLLGIFPTSIADDEDSYAYWTWSLRSTLFTVDWEEGREP